MTTYVEHVEHDRRLVILRLLADNAGTANDRMLQTGLAKWGIRCALTTVASSLTWLVEQGFAVTRPVNGSGVWVAEITRRGREISEGLAESPGITPRRLVAD